MLYGSPCSAARQQGTHLPRLFLVIYFGPRVLATRVSCSGAGLLSVAPEATYDGFALRAEAANTLKACRSGGTTHIRSIHA
jgi:hypothetical protein